MNRQTKERENKCVLNIRYPRRAKQITGNLRRGNQPSNKMTETVMGFLSTNWGKPRFNWGTEKLHHPHPKGIILNKRRNVFCLGFVFVSTCPAECAFGTDKETVGRRERIVTYCNATYYRCSRSRCTSPNCCRVCMDSVKPWQNSVSCCSPRQLDATRHKHHCIAVYCGVLYRLRQQESTVGCQERKGTEK